MDDAAGYRAVAPAPFEPCGRRLVLSRRRALAAALLAPLATSGLGACTGGGVGRTKAPDPLVALADAARADAALAAAAITANPGLADRVEPLRAARAEHAAALDAEVVRMGGTPRSAAPAAPQAPPGSPPSGSPPSRSPRSATPSGEPSASATGVTQAVTLTRVREAVAASQRAAAELVPGLPADRVGLVASVAACCATYTAVLA